MDPAPPPSPPPAAPAAPSVDTTTAGAPTPAVPSMAPTAPLSYDMANLPPRNLMDEIVPGLYLGSLDAATDHGLLAAHKITHILSLTSSELPVKPPKHIHHTHHIVRDVKTSNLMEILLSSLDTLEGAFTGALPILNEDGEATTTTAADGSAPQKQVRVLVHCRMGISRSASVVLAYLLKHHRHLCPTLRDSITFLRTRRFCINPNRGFRAQLEILADVGFDRDLVRDLGLLELGHTLENVYDPEEETLAEERRRKGGSSSSSSAERKRRKWEDLVRSWDDNPSEWMRWRLDVKGDGEEEREQDRAEQEATLRECVKHAEGVARQARRWKRMQQAALGDAYDAAGTAPPPSSRSTATHRIPPSNLTTTPSRIRQLLLLPSPPPILAGDLTTALTHLGKSLEHAISSHPFSLSAPSPVADDAMDLDVDDDDGPADTAEKGNGQEFVMQDPRGKEASLVQAEHVAEMEEREKLVEEQVRREAAAAAEAGGTAVGVGGEKDKAKGKEDIDGDVNMG